LPGCGQVVVARCRQEASLPVSLPLVIARPIFCNRKSPGRIVRFDIRDEAGRLARRPSIARNRKRRVLFAGEHALFPPSHCRSSRCFVEERLCGGEILLRESKDGEGVRCWTGKFAVPKLIEHLLEVTTGRTVLPE